MYDCVYLALAAEREIPLVTADERLARVAAHGSLANVEVITLKNPRGRIDDFVCAKMDVDDACTESRYTAGSADCVLA